MKPDTTSTIHKSMRIEDKAKEKFEECFEIQLSPTEVRQMKLSPSKVHDLRTLEGELLDHGAVLPSDQQERKIRLEALAESEAAEQFVYEARGGWLRPGKTFVFSDGAVGVETTNILGVSPSLISKDLKGVRTESGTLTSWRDSVGQLARLSSIMMFTTSAALAAPLFALTGDQSFGFCLYGKTRTGKSVATLLSASLIGIDDKDNLLDWNATEAALEERLTEFTDLLFPIDDLETMKGSERDRYFKLRGLAYRLSQGSSTTRHSSFTKSHEGGHGRWKCIAVTSAEKSIQDMAKALRLERQGGEYLRLIDLPAILPDQTHIFDRAKPPVDKFKAWRDATFATIATECRTNHGVAFREYIEKIIAADFDVADHVRNAASTFVGRVVDSSDGVVARDVAAKFGLIYAGGLLGIKFKIVLWQEEELLDAIAKCYRAARDILPDEGVALRNGLALLMKRLRQLPRRKILKEAKSTDWDRTDGYRIRTKDENRYVLKGEIFNAIFATEAQRDLVLQHLIDEKQLTLALRKGGTATSATPKKQFKWPDDQRRRSYEIVIPRS
jgi:Domain of unknown function (DUF927)